MEKMVVNKEEIKQEIWWQVKAGNNSLWYDNWTQQGALYYIEEAVPERSALEVRSFITNDEWDQEKLKSVLSEDMARYIMDSIKHFNTEGIDHAWWMENAKGEFL
uniref:Putative ovule protein n=1 Tax=Solanum chacoense TaxID=4108 RepID=A0A0V0HGK0_SOLCH